MKLKKMKSLTAAFLSACILNPAAAGFTYPFAITASAKDQVISGKDGDYTYEMFNAADAGKVTMYQNDNGGFNCEWKDTLYTDFKKGYSYDTPIDCDSIHKLDLSYECEFMPLGSAVFGVNGHLSGADADFFIVEAAGNWEMPENAVAFQTTEINGKMYKIYTSEKDGRITYWSVYESSTVKPSKLTFLNGEISFAEHLSAWNLAGLDIMKSGVADFYICIHSENGGGSAFVNEFNVIDKSFTQSIIKPYMTTTRSTQETTATSTVTTAVTTTTSVTTASPVTGDYLEQGKANGYDYKLWNKGGTGDAHITNRSDNGFRAQWDDVDHLRVVKGSAYEKPQNLGQMQDISVQYDGAIKAGDDTVFGAMGKLDSGAFFAVIEGWGTRIPSENMEKITSYSSHGKKYGLYMKEAADVYDYDGTLLRDQTVYYCIAEDNAVGTDEEKGINGFIFVGDHLYEMKKAGIENIKVTELYLGAESHDTSGYIDISSLCITKCDVDIYPVTTASESGFPDSYTVTVTEDDFPMKNIIKSGNGDFDLKGTDENGYTYEIWDVYRQGSVGYENTPEGGFRCAWAGVEDVMFIKGVLFRDMKQAEDYSTLKVSYDMDFLPEGNGFIGAYGWMKDPLIEYYIVEGWGAWRPPGDWECLGTYESGGDSYDLYRSVLTNFGIMANSSTLVRCYAVRTENKAVPYKNTHITGEIDVADHFNSWRKLGLETGNLYELCLCVEGFRSSGTADVRSLNIDCGDDYELVPNIPLPADYVCRETFEYGADSFMSRGNSFLAVANKDVTECLQITGAGDNTAGAYYIPPVNRMEAGKSYSLSLKCYGTDAENNKITVKLRSGHFDPAERKMVYKYITLADEAIEPDKWNDITCPVFTLPDDAQDDVRIYIDSDTSGSIFIDDFIIRDVERYKSAPVQPVDDDSRISSGDINGDGVVNAFDALLCRREFCKMLNGEEYDTSIDINGDGVFSISDLILINGYVSGKFSDMDGTLSMIGYKYGEAVDGYSYEIWNEASQGTVNMTPDSYGSFSCNWDGVVDCIFTAGKHEFRGRYLSPTLEYSGDMEMHGDAYYGCYGWLRDELAEFYIVDGWTGKRPFADVEPAYSFEANGKRYNVYRVKKENSPSIIGTEASYYQYWSIAEENDNADSNYNGVYGYVSLEDHIYAWNYAFSDANLTMEGLYEFDMFIEGLKNSSGYADMKTYIDPNN